MSTSLREALAERIEAVGEARPDLDALIGLGEARLRHRRRTGAFISGVIAAVVAVAIVLAGGRNPHTVPKPIGIPSPAVTQVSKKLVLHLRSAGGASPQCPPSDIRTVGCRTPVDLAVYADGHVIWGHQDMEGYVQTRLSPEGLTWLTSRIRSSGLFERDLALGVAGSSGDLTLHRSGRSVIVAWGQKPAEVSDVGMQDQFVDSTPAQTHELVDLEKFLRDPVAWALPRRMFEQREPSPFVPTHLWVSWDRSKPDPSKLPSPAREILTSNLEAALTGSCEIITIAQAQEIANAMNEAGYIKPDDVADGIAFDMPGQGGSHSFFHAHPALPNESTCD